MKFYSNNIYYCNQIKWQWISFRDYFQRGNIDFKVEINFIEKLLRWWLKDIAHITLYFTLFDTTFISLRSGFRIVIENSMNKCQDLKIPLLHREMENEKVRIKLVMMGTHLIDKEVKSNCTYF